MTNTITNNFDTDFSLPHAYYDLTDTDGNHHFFAANTGDDYDTLYNYSDDHGFTIKSYLPIDADNDADALKIFFNGGFTGFNGLKPLPKFKPFFTPSKK